MGNSTAPENSFSGAFFVGDFSEIATRESVSVGDFSEIATRASLENWPTACRRFLRNRYVCQFGKLAASGAQVRLPTWGQVGLQWAQTTEHLQRNTKMLVDVKVHDGVATILMNRAEVRNALNPPLVADLQTALSDVHQEKRATAVVLTGAGEHFCSGVDLKVLAKIAQMPQPEALGEWLTIWRHQVELLEQMLRFPKPIIAAVDGVAVGSGLALALAADLILPSSGASFSAAAVQRGLVGGATAALLSFRFGGAIAARMLLSGEEIAADEAHRLGMCMPAVQPEQIWVAACDLARRCGSAPREAVQATKRLLNESIGETLLTQLSSGAADSATACTTESAAEGIQAFLEHRQPQWP